MKKMYHITSKENLDEIMSKGLIPLKGNNPEINNEEDPAIYLCDYKDIWIWKLILDKDVVLEISNIDKYDVKFNRYLGFDREVYYEESICFNKIDAKDIKMVDIDQTIDMHKFVEISILRLNENINDIARHLIYQVPTDFIKMLKHNLRVFLRSYDKVDAEWISNNDEKVFAFLQRIADHGYNTFLDNIGNTEIKLYKILPIASSDIQDKELSDLISNLYDWINKKFNKSILSTAIGQCDTFIQFY